MIRKTKSILFLFLLSLAIFTLMACRPGSSPEAIETAVIPSRANPPTPVESPVIETGTAVATSVNATLPTRTKVSVQSADLLIEHVRESGGYDDSVEIEIQIEMEIPSLPGLTLYAVTPMLVDMSADRCAVLEQMVWCHSEGLANLIQHYELGANPDQLSDEEWLTLLSFFYGTTPLQSAEDLVRTAGHMPEEEMAKISPPESGGVSVSYFFEYVDPETYAESLRALARAEFKASDQNTIDFQYEDIWLSLEEAWLDR